MIVYCYDNTKACVGIINLSMGGRVEVRYDTDLFEVSEPETTTDDGINTIVVSGTLKDR